jgi:hypothetical protein
MHKSVTYSVMIIQFSSVLYKRGDLRSEWPVTERAQQTNPNNKGHIQHKYTTKHKNNTTNNITINIIRSNIISYFVRQ